MPHFCLDELNVLLCSIPFIGIGIHYVRSWLGRRPHKHGHCVVYNGRHVSVVDDPRIK